MPKPVERSVKKQTSGDVRMTSDRLIKFFTATSRLLRAADEVKKAEEELLLAEREAVECEVSHGK